MTIPVQIWIPFLWTSPLDATFARDFQRAQHEWRGEQYVWLDPDVGEVRRWMQREEDELPEYACLVPSESLNGLSIVHLDEGRRVHPLLPLPDAWQNTLPEGLYRQWLSTMPDFIEGHTSLSLLWPVATDTQIAYEERELTLDPGPIMPIVGFDERDRTVTMAWPPPEAKVPPPISVEMESKHFYGQLFRTTITTDGKEMPVVVSKRNPKSRAFNIWLQWSAPFDLFFPHGGGIDLLQHHAAMSGCIRKIDQGQREEARKIAAMWVNRLTGEAEASLELAWFLPKVWTDPDSILADVEGKFNLAYHDLDELVQSRHFQKILRQPVKVRQVQGWLGYFWWELYQDIVENVALRCCRQCGRLLRGGHRDVQYCPQQENPDCYRQRNAARQRKRRRGKPS